MARLETPHHLSPLLAGVPADRQAHSLTIKHHLVACSIVLRLSDLLEGGLQHTAFAGFQARLRGQASLRCGTDSLLAVRHLTPAAVYHAPLLTAYHMAAWYLQVCRLRASFQSWSASATSKMVQLGVAMKLTPWTPCSVVPLPADQLLRLVLAVDHPDRYIETFLESLCHRVALREMTTRS